MHVECVIVKSVCLLDPQNDGVSDVRSVRLLYGHTMTVSFPRTAVAMRKAIAIFQSQSAKNVCAARAQKQRPGLLKAKDQVL